MTTGEHRTPLDNWAANFDFESIEDVGENISELKSALEANQIAIVRLGEDLGTSNHVQIARQFGSPERVLPISTRHEDSEYIELVRRDHSDKEYSPIPPENSRVPSSFIWHSDRSFLANPSRYSMARVIHAPDSGGSTEFINTRRLFEFLDPEMQDMMRDYSAVHAYAHYHLYHSPNYYSFAEKSHAVEQGFAVHPLVRNDPQTGSESLYYSPLAVTELIDPEGNLDHWLKSQLDELIDTAEFEPAIFYSHQWQPNELIIWDNYGMLHRGTASIGERELHRVTLTTDD